MRTVRTSRRFEGSHISVRGLCELEARDLPARLSDILADDEFRLFQGEITAGDVRCKWHMSVWRNGFWSVTGDFHDDGVIAGDFFTITFMLDPGHSVGAALKGSILDLTDNRNLTVSASGSDPWIRQNWSRFEASGPSVRLSAKIAPGALIALAGVVVVIIGGAAFGKKSGSADSFTIRPCPGQFQRDSAGEFPSGPACIDVQ